MIPAITKGGRSFKGAFLYYAHDKQAMTAARLAWSETINLRTTNPERAWKIMAATALAQGRLKAAAGVKATGRKLEKPVHAYSLSWHPTERPTRAEMIEAARESLAVQGLENHQAIILAH